MRLNRNMYCAAMIGMKKATFFHAIATRLSSRLLDRDLSATVNNETRKVVIYARLQPSPGKLGWKLVVILTCKSFV